MTCDHCTRARAGIWGGYLTNCSECIARALARSLHAFNALHDRGTGERDELRHAIQRACRASTTPPPAAWSGPGGSTTI